jgi:MFS transporter, DHA3 family, tetracycline resistance protein
VLMGLGFMVEVSLPRFGIVLLAQVIWGVGYTFTSGAREAWIADEVGPTQADRAFLSGAQWGAIGALAGIPLSVVLAGVDIRLPVFIGGLLYAVQGVALAFLMPETGFVRATASSRTPLAQAIATFREGAGVLRRQHLLLALLVAGAVFGAFSEGFDRLWTPFLVRGFTFPDLGRLPTVYWFGIIQGVAMLLGLAGTDVVRRRWDAGGRAIKAPLLLGLHAAIAGMAAGFALAGNFYVALACWWSSMAARRTAEPIYTAWVNGRLPSEVRATVLSMTSQGNALGQIVGGPVLGLLATAVSLRVGLLASALLLMPVVGVYGVLARAGTVRPVIPPME